MNANEANRIALINALQANDRNGSYTDDQAIAEGMSPLTFEQARELAVDAELDVDAILAGTYEHKAAGMTDERIEAYRAAAVLSTVRRCPPVCRTAKPVAMTVDALERAEQARLGRALRRNRR